MRIARERGAIDAIRALRMRLYVCRGDYRWIISREDLTFELLLADGSVLKHKDISEQLLDDTA